MDLEKWKELISHIFNNLCFLFVVIVIGVTISQLIVNAAYINKIIKMYKEIGQILPFS